VLSTKKHIVAFLSFLSILGMFMSTIHYHSESLECLQHQGEKHFTPDEDVCPLCSLVLSSDFSATLSKGIDLIVLDTVLPQAEQKINHGYIHPNLGRSPPFLA
tara:strand:- start:1465 stop:1773 length:309 start_codon:yes stop_codon:yes gene_type:complete